MIITTLREKIWNLVSNFYPWFLRTAYGMNIGVNVRISYKATLDKSINPKGIHIGNNSWVLAKSIILAHDYCRGSEGRGKRYETIIGNNCVIGISSIIMPGIKIGNHVVVGAGTVITKDIPSNSLVVGNPGRIIKEDIKVSDQGQIIE